MPKNGWVIYVLSMEKQMTTIFFKNMKIPLQEVAILKQTMFRKAECGKKVKTINSKHDAIRSVLLCAFSCEEVLTSDSN